MIFSKYFSTTVVIDINAYYITTYEVAPSRARPNPLRGQDLRLVSIVVRYVGDYPVGHGNEFHFPVNET